MAESIDVTCVMNGDAQMDPADLITLVAAVARGECDYAKANRVCTPDARRVIPSSRYVGIIVLSLLTKVASGYWKIGDSQSGYTAVNLETLRELDLDGLYPRYGFPNDMLVHLNVGNRRVREFPSRPIYGIGEESGIRLPAVIPALSWLLFSGFWWRLKEKYLVRDFHPLVVFYAIGTLSSQPASCSARSRPGFRLLVDADLLARDRLRRAPGCRIADDLLAMWLDRESNKGLRAERLAGQEQRAGNCKQGLKIAFARPGDADPVVYHRRGEAAGASRFARCARRSACACGSRQQPRRRPLRRGLHALRRRYAGLRHAPGARRRRPAPEPVLEPRGDRPGRQRCRPGDPAYDWSLYDRAVTLAGERTSASPLHHRHARLGERRQGREVRAHEVQRPPGLRQSGGYAVLRQLRPRPRTPSGIAAPLGQVVWWVAWNEPNAPTFLQPQSRKVGKRYVFTSPSSTRRSAMRSTAGSMQPVLRTACARPSPAGPPTRAASSAGTGTGTPSRRSCSSRG